MSKPVVRGDSKVVIVCPDCDKTEILRCRQNPTSAGGFICGIAAAIDDMKKNHKCLTEAPALTLVD